MDLHFGDSKPTDEERAAVDALLGPPESSWEGADRSDADLRWARGGRAARNRRDLLLPGLHALNDRVGWISEGGLGYQCRRLTVPPAEAYGVATFYAMFSVRPRPATVLHVCTDLACTAAGADALRTGLEERLGSGVSVERSPCLGLCERAPAALAVSAGDPVRTAVAAPASVDEAVRAAGAPDSAPEEPPAATAVPQAGQEGLVLLRRVGAVRQRRTSTVCAYCGVGCTLTLHVQDNEIVKVTSPHDNPVTHGNLCIKGRFGCQHVQNRG
ncbi:NAD(P)H-dependent oxidoreductase subunit E [Streptomyces sp. NPDC003233]